MAEALGVTVGTLANWRHAGKGPLYTKLVGRVWYRKDDVRAFIEAQPSRQSTAEAVAA
jgi:predicted site-specific integrase-resolvase